MRNEQNWKEKRKINEEERIKSNKDWNSETNEYTQMGNAKKKLHKNRFKYMIAEMWSYVGILYTKSVRDCDCMYVQCDLRACELRAASCESWVVWNVCFDIMCFVCSSTMNIRKAAATNKNKHLNIDRRIAFVQLPVAMNLYEQIYRFACMCDRSLVDFSSFFSTLFRIQSKHKHLIVAFYVFLQLPLSFIVL